MGSLCLHPLSLSLLHQLHQAIGVHEELVVVCPLVLDGGCVAVDDVRDLRREGAGRLTGENSRNSNTDRRIMHSM